MDQYCVIGDPIAHSLSPSIYRILFKEYGIKAEYDARRVTKESLPAFIEQIADSSIRGFNVTMPLKKDVEAYLAYRDPDARFGVNTVVVREDGLHGYSTDAAGFRRSLAAHGICYDGRRVVFLGCGGAGRALIWDALHEGAKHVTIINRTPKNADMFSADQSVTVGTWNDAASACTDCSLLINTTPLGMHGVAATFDNLTFLDALPKDAFVADLIYNPLQPALLAAAHARGLSYMNGLGMLTWQGVLAFQKYTGILAPDSVADTIRKALARELTDRT